MKSHTYPTILSGCPMLCPVQDIPVSLTLAQGRGSSDTCYMDVILLSGCQNATISSTCRRETWSSIERAHTELLPLR